MSELKQNRAVVLCKPFSAVLDRLNAVGKEEKSSLPLLPKPSIEAPAVSKREAAAKRAAQIEKEKQLQVNWR